ncbi:transposase [Vitiosangium sp. GDMCC 1.1324]|uniref:transposase n=1 Tax=Vitiosangium sp. (strain GDMCC 1.1324) TaxID=2138576 RepID=UPI0035138D8C
MRAGAEGPRRAEGLLSGVLTLFLRAVFAPQRRRARRQGVRGGQTGAVSFLQFFGSALQVTPHYHALVPEGVCVPGEGCVRFEALPPPTQGEVERLLRVVRHRVGARPGQACTPRGLRGLSTGREHRSGGPVSAPRRPCGAAPCAARLPESVHRGYVREVTLRKGARRPRCRRHGPTLLRCTRSASLET